LKMSQIRYSFGMRMAKKKQTANRARWDEEAGLLIPSGTYLLAKPINEIFPAAVEAALGK